MVPYLNILTELACQYNLDLTEGAVLAAVQFYCRKTPHSWKRNAEQICRDWPYMPSVTTVKRVLKKLIKKGLLTVQNDRIIVQIDRQNVQIDRKIVQNDRLLNNKINNNNIFSSSASRADEKEKEVLDDSSSKNTSDSEPTYDGIPTWDEAWEYAKNNGITFRETKKFYNYFNAYGWIDKYGRPVKQWASLFQSFVDDLHDRDRQQAARFATRAQSGYPETAWGDRQRAMDARMRDEREVIEGFRARERARRAAEQAAEQAESDQSENT